MSSDEDGTEVTSGAREETAEPSQPMQSGDGPGLAGQLLAERYRVKSRLGGGGMASVFLARDERLGRTVVIKVPHAGLLVDSGFRRRFQGEISNLTRLEHPNVIQIHDVGEHEGVPFAVVQYLRGGDLSDRIKAAGGHLSPAQVFEWLPRIALALDFVHERGFLHRDVSPGNIIFDEHGNALLSDFGIATADSKGDDPDETLHEYTNLTKPGGFVGNATYAPPESIERKLNPGYDQYSLGVVVYESLSGALPFERGPAEAMLVAKNTSEPAPLDDRTPGLPAGVLQAVMRAISKDPAARFRSSREFVEAFEAGMQSRPSLVPKTEVVEHVDLPSPGGRGKWIAAGGGGLLLLAGLAAYLWDGPGLPWGEIHPPVPTQRVTGQSLVRFQAGSLPEERQFAYDLCAQLLGASGCDPAKYAEEVARDVEIRPVELDPREVTNREFASFVAESGHRTTAEKRGYSYHGIARGTDLSWRAPIRRVSHTDRLDHPVVHVSRFDAAAYCEAQGQRLPSEEEWEFHARGTARRVFPWGDSWDESRGGWASGRPKGTRPVGKLRLGDTPDGLQDMGGNVWEWTSSELRGDQGLEGIMKGGSWFEDPSLLRGAARLRDRRDYSSSDVGFRCARDL